MKKELTYLSFLQREEEKYMEAQKAYNLSDLYIQKADVCKTVEEIYELQTAKITDYTKHMKKIHAHNIRNSNTDQVSMSRPVLKALDYIYYHLHKKICLEDVSKASGVSPNYLNSLFGKEKGISIQKYICFIRVFRSITDITPRQFAKRYFRTHNR